MNLSTGVESTCPNTAASETRKTATELMNGSKALSNRDKLGAAEKSALIRQRLAADDLLGAGSSSREHSADIDAAHGLVDGGLSSRQFLQIIDDHISTCTSELTLRFDAESSDDAAYETVSEADEISAATTPDSHAPRVSDLITRQDLKYIDDETSSFRSKPSTVSHSFKTANSVDKSSAESSSRASVSSVEQPFGRSLNWRPDHRHYRESPDSLDAYDDDDDVFSNDFATCKDKHTLVLSVSRPLYVRNKPSETHFDLSDSDLNAKAIPKPDVNKKTDMLSASDDDDMG